MQHSKGFTLIELTIVVALITIIAAGTIALIDPLETTRWGRDQSFVSIMRNLSHGLTANYGYNIQYLPSQSTAISLGSDGGQAVINKLITLGYLKENFLKENFDKLKLVYLTGDSRLDQHVFCFVPQSKKLKTSGQTIYNRSGNVTDCKLNECHYCLGGNLNNEATSIHTEYSTLTNTCTDFNPNYPAFIDTYGYDGQFSEYDCNHFGTSDRGCDEFCPTGQRHMVKSYYYSYTGPGGGDLSKFLNCLSHWQEAQEHYCVAGAAAGCEIKTYQSSPSDFVYGCSNPTRPIEWKVRLEEQE